MIMKIGEKTVVFHIKYYVFPEVKTKRTTLFPEL